MSAFDKDILATLEPEERAALESESTSTEDAAALARIAGGAEGDEEDADDGGVGDPNEVLDADGKLVPQEAVVVPLSEIVAAKAESTEAPAAMANAPAPAPAAPVVDADAPREYVSTLPEDYDTKVADLKVEQDALKAKFKDGDIDIDQYTAANEALAEQRAALSEAKITDNVSRQMHERAEFQSREAAVTKLFESALGQGVNYDGEPARFEELKATMTALKGMSAWANRSFQATLNEAHRRVMLVNGITAAAPAAAPAADPAAAPAPAPASRRPPIDAAPKTLAQVPGGEGAGDMAGEFADIDRLDGDALEAAIERMSPAQRERYQRGN